MGIKPLSNVDIKFLKNKYEDDQLFGIFQFIVCLFVFMVIYYSMIFEQNVTLFSKCIYWFFVLFFLLLFISGVKSHFKNKKKILSQKKVATFFEVLKKEIYNENDEDSSNEYVITIYSDFEEKEKIIYLSYADFNKIILKESIYLEYFYDSFIIKTIKYNSKFIKHKKYQIYDNK